MADKGNATKNGKKRPRNLAQITLDRAEIAKLMRKGKTQSEIAEHLGVTTSMVSSDWQSIVRGLNEDREADAKYAVTLRLTQLRHIQFEALEAWDRSKEQFQKVVEEESVGSGLGGSRSKSTRITETRQPGAEFLNVAMKCVREMNELEGLYPEKKIALDANIVNWDMIMGATEASEDVIEAEILKVSVREVMGDQLQLSQRTVEVGIGEKNGHS